MSSAPERFAPQALTLLCLCVRALGWRPDDFWQATPADLAAILAPVPPASGEGIDRATLQAMMDQDHER